MPTRYEALLFVHVLAVVLWVGGATMHLALMQLARRSGEREHMVLLLRYDDRLGPLYYVPAGLIAFLAGIGLMAEGNWGFDQSWIVAGIVLFALAFVGGAAFFIPMGKRLAAAVAAHGPSSPETHALVSRIELAAAADLIVLYAAVFVMTVKPGL